MTLHLPPVRLPERPGVHKLCAGTLLVRFYDPARGPWPQRRTFGPLPDMRFDHRVKVGGSVVRSVWYASTSLQGAVSEVFGRLGFIDRESGKRIAVVRVVSKLLVLDLVGTAARRVGLTQEIAAATDSARCQAWARAFYRQYPSLVGIRWRGRESGAICFVLNDRAPTAALTVQADHHVSDSAVWPRVARAARRCKIRCL